MARISHRGGRVRRPAFGADDRGMAVELVVSETEDGKRWDGMVFLPREGMDRRRRLAVLVLHGSLGNYVSGVPRRLAFGLSSAGFTVMTTNTRMANYGVIFGGGLMHRTPLDIDAALAVLRRRGFRRIVLLGFSLGATMVTHYQALRQPLDVVGVCTLAHPASLPSALRLRWSHFGAEPGYEEVVEHVHVRLAPDYESEKNDRIFLVRRGRGFGDRPLDGEIWTYRSWWFSRGPRAPHAESRLRVGRGHRSAGPDPGRRRRAGAHVRGGRAGGPGAPGRLPQRVPAHRAGRRPRLHRLGCGDDRCGHLLARPARG